MAFVTNITTDWAAQSTQLLDGISYIKTLDGKTRTNVIFEGNDSYLLVGGGENGKYITFIAVNSDEKFYNLVDPLQSDDAELKMIVGGQAGMYAAKQCVNLGVVLEAAQYFYEIGKPAPSLTWDVDPSEA